MNERIIVQCAHAGYFAARINAMPNGIVIEYGLIEDNKFIVGETERLNYDEHPEVLSVYVAGAWDVAKLAALVNDCCEEVEE